MTKSIRRIFEGIAAVMAAIIMAIFAVIMGAKLLKCQIYVLETDSWYPAGTILLGRAFGPDTGKELALQVKKPKCDTSVFYKEVMNRIYIVAGKREEESSGEWELVRCVPKAIIPYCGYAMLFFTTFEGGIFCTFFFLLCFVLFKWRAVDRKEEDHWRFLPGNV